MGSGYSLKKSASGPRPPTNLECSIRARGGSLQLAGTDLLLVPRAQLSPQRSLLAQCDVFI